MPRGGFGNLIALPLQSFLPTWAGPGRAQVEAIVRDAEQRGRVLGVRLPSQEDAGEDEPSIDIMSSINNFSDTSR